ncbi:MAG: class I SAM-dependent methyltransferase [Ramlibacter sp.]
MRAVLATPGMAAMGHAQDAQRGDPGLGWLYYALARLVKPSIAVVIGSWRGFVPAMLGRALADDGDGQVQFIDPSLVDGFWRDPHAVQAHFARLGLSNVTHWRMTTQQFVASAAYLQLKETALVFIDGYHSLEQARFDYLAFRHLVPAHGMVLFHDSIRVRPSRIYGEHKVYEHRVRDLMDELRADAGLQVLDLPYGDGLTLVRAVAVPEALRL